MKPSQVRESKLDCYWVGSLDFNLFGKFMGFPLNPQKVVNFLQGGSTATKAKVRKSRVSPPLLAWRISFYGSEVPVLPLGQSSRTPPLFGSRCFDLCHSLPEFMNFKLFGKTILVVNIQFGLFLGPSTQPVRSHRCPLVWLGFSKRVSQPFKRTLEKAGCAFLPFTRFVGVFFAWMLVDFNLLIQLMGVPY